MTCETKTVVVAIREQTRDWRVEGKVWGTFPSARKALRFVAEQAPEAHVVWMPKSIAGAAIVHALTQVRAGGDS